PHPSRHPTPTRTGKSFLPATYDRSQICRWVVTGTPEPPDVLLRLGPTGEQCWGPVGAALAAVGLPGATFEHGPGGPAYRVSGRRQLARLAELVGDRPRAAPALAWPTRF
ncbi:hypothetical protein AB0I76_18425, partial [Micromonospora sp. NPDC049799]